ncbi:MAG: dihydrofolate reductase [Rhodothalassiaceae bacterium]
MIVTLIAARASNGVIGRSGGLPWRLPEDLKRFKSLTLNKPVIMGRKTYDSIGKPLARRRNVVITRQRDWRAPGVERAGSLKAALDLCADAPELMVIGGAQIYGQALPLARRLELTEVQADIDGDTYFPPIGESDWIETFREPHPDADPPFIFRTLQR